ncbi:TPA: Gfo/Idh/MocA family oxidoreductase [Aeromonas veronii]|nr:Gfo/Idh/MocA family oxidoreductase [Aeromonas veronii]
MNKINFLLIGFGPHSKRIFYPIFEEISNDSSLVLKAAIDLESKREIIEQYIGGRKVQPEMHYLNNDEPIQDELTSSTVKLLNLIVEEHSINAVIIATEPLVHRAYATWALKAGLSILMDKPISANINVSSDISSAKKSQRIIIS